MKAVIGRAAFLAAALLLAAGGTARAGSFEVKVPFPFVVNGQQLPAGQYRLVRDGDSVVLIRGEKLHMPAMYVSTMPAAGRDPAGDQPALTFVKHQDQYLLTDIRESGQELAAVQSTPPSPAHAKHSTGTHATRGVVKSIDDATLVITPSGKNHADMTFAMNASTERSGTIAAGTSVSVRYRDDAKMHVATAVRVDPANPKTAAHATTK